MSPAVVTAFEHQALTVGDDRQSMLTHGEAARLMELGAARPGFCTQGHRSVRLAQYAGLVNLGGRMLEVLPKVGDESAAGESRGTFLRMLRLASGVPLFSRDSASHDLHRHSLLSVFVAAYLDAVSKLVRGGLLRLYRTRTGDLRVVRGRLSVAKQAAVHGLRPDLLACRFDELTTDNAWNQVLHSALARVRPWIDSIADARRWLELVPAFDEVALRGDALGLIENLRSDRQVRHYAPAMRWAELILRLLSPSIRAGHSDAPECLFDMNRLFESSVASVLGSHCSRAGLRLSTQENVRFLAKLDSPQGGPMFRLRPDLVLRDATGVIAVADTKWMRIQTDVNGRMIPPETHAYQMHAYSSAYQCRDLYLVYPWHQDVVDALPTSFRMPSADGRPVCMHVLCVDVGKDDFPLRKGFDAWEQLLQGRRQIEIRP